MVHVLFLPNDHLLVWLPSIQPYSRYQTASDLARCIERGEWTLPADWLERLGGFLRLPNPLELHARAFDRLLVIFPRQPLEERAPALEFSDTRLDLPLEPELAEVLRLLSCGLTASQISEQMGHSRRWVRYRIADLKQRLGAASRAEILGRGR